MRVVVKEKYRDKEEFQPQAEATLVAAGIPVTGWKQRLPTVAEGTLTSYVTLEGRVFEYTPADPTDARIKFLVKDVFDLNERLHEAEKILEGNKK